MKKLAYILSLSLYYLGDLVWRKTEYYPLYNKLMIWSSNIEDFAGINKVWQKPEGGTSI